MKLFLWTNKLLFLVTQLFIYLFIYFFASVFVIMNFIDLSLNSPGKSYNELINVCNLTFL